MSTTDLPKNWERKTDPRTGRAFFLNHNTKRTTWVDPRLNRSLAFRQTGEEEVNNATTPAATSSSASPQGNKKVSFSQATSLSKQSSSSSEEESMELSTIKDLSTLSEKQKTGAEKALKEFPSAGKETVESLSKNFDGNYNSIAARLRDMGFKPVASATASATETANKTLSFSEKQAMYDKLALEFPGVTRSAIETGAIVHSYNEDKARAFLKNMCANRTNKSETTGTPATSTSKVTINPSKVSTGSGKVSITTTTSDELELGNDVKSQIDQLWSDDIFTTSFAARRSPSPVNVPKTSFSASSSTTTGNKATATTGSKVTTSGVASSSLSVTSAANTKVPSRGPSPTPASSSSTSSNATSVKPRNAPASNVAYVATSQSSSSSSSRPTRAPSPLPLSSSAVAAIKPVAKRPFSSRTLAQGADSSIRSGPNKQFREGPSASLRKGQDSTLYQGPKASNLVGANPNLLAQSIAG